MLLYISIKSPFGKAYHVNHNLCSRTGLFTVFRLRRNLFVDEISDTRGSPLCVFDPTLIWHKPIEIQGTNDKLTEAAYPRRVFAATKWSGCTLKFRRSRNAVKCPVREHKLWFIYFYYAWSLFMQKRPAFARGAACSITWSICRADPWTLCRDGLRP